jgi:hypothetical protein
VCSSDDVACIEKCSQYPEQCMEPYEVADDYYGATFYLSIILGFVILSSQFVDILLVLTPRRWRDGNDLIQRLVLPGTVRQQRAGKQAASYRMKILIQNSLDVINGATMLASSANSNSLDAVDRESSILERFLLTPKTTEAVGGVSWAWKRIWNGTLFTEEGIWLTGRLLACNFAQVTVFGILIFFTRVFYHKQKDLFYSDEETQYNAYISQASAILYGNYTIVLGEDYYAFVACTQEVLAVDLYTEGSGYIDYLQPWNLVVYLSTQFGNYTSVKEGVLKPCFDAFPQVSAFFDDSYNVLTHETDAVNDLVQGFELTKGQYIAAVWAGLACGFLAVMYIAFQLIPSYISTVMKYRSGVLSSLTDHEFLRYRYAMDTVTVLLGSAFWGCFFTATGAMLFVVGVVRYYFQNFPVPTTI